MVTVLYDGACLLCAREIAMYRRQHSTDAIRLTRRAKFQKVTFRSAYRDKPPSGSTLSGDGSVAVGAAGFELWKAILQATPGRSSCEPAAGFFHSRARLFAFPARPPDHPKIRRAHPIRLLDERSERPTAKRFGRA